MRFQRFRASYYRAACVVVAHIACTSLACGASTSTLRLVVSNEIAPAGGWVQIKVSAAAPAQVAGGRIVMSLDPAVFGPIASVAVFSAAGDATGVAVVTGETVDANFVSASASIGQLPSLPILTATVPILASATASQVSAIMIDPSQSAWTGENGATYAVTAAAGSVTVGGTLSVESLTPGGGLQPAGTMVSIAGAGFSSATTVSVAGVSLTSSQFINPNEIDVTLGGAADFTGKQVVLTNPDGSSVVFFSATPSVPESSPANNGQNTIYQPLLPMQTWASGEIVFPSLLGTLALQNPNAVPVSVLVEGEEVGGAETQQTVTLAPGALQALQLEGSVAYAFPSLPVRMMGILYNPLCFGSQLCAWALQPYPATPPLQQVSAEPAAVSFSWQVGSAAPAPVTVRLQSNNFPFGVTWTGAPFSISSSATLPGSLAVSVNTAGLQPGTYTGSITVTPAGPNSVVTTIPLTLTVTATVQLQVNATSLTLFSGEGPSVLSITSNGNPVPFTVTAGANSSPLWFTVTPTSGATPAQLSVSANPGSTTAPGVYSGQIVITGLNNSITVPVQLTVSASTIFTFSQESVVFSVQSGSTAPPAQTVEIHGPSSGVVVSATTSSGGNWLSVTSAPSVATISANLAGLGVGTYSGAIMVTSPDAPAPASLSVTLVIWNQQPVLTVNPPSVTFSVPVQQLTGTSPSQALQISSGGTPVDFTTSLENGTFATPAAISVGPQSSQTLTGPALLGATVSNVTFTSGGQTVTVPVTTVITTGPGTPPFLGAVVNAASQIPGSVSPGEIVTVYGFGAGPSATAGFTLDSSGNAAAGLNGAQVLFDGNPAPMIYGSSYQANVIVPYAVAGEAATSIALENGGVVSGAWSIPVASSAPGIFTLGGAGTGQAAVLNQDNSVNAASKPAPRGSVVQIYATGEGQTNPPGVTGSIITSNTKQPVLPVTVSIGGQNAAVEYAGSAADAVSGLLQVNAVVPQGATPGPAVPVTISVGGAPSQSGVTLAIQ